MIGTHSGSYSVYRALAVAAGALSRQHKADLTNTAPTDVIGPYPQWGEPGKIVSLDPWGALVADVFAAELAAGYDIRPTIAVTKAHVILPEVIEGLQTGRLKADGKVLTAGGAAMVTKAAIEPVWWLPGVAQRFGCSETDLRRVLFEETGGMYPELVTRSDLEVFLPPIGGQTVYIFGNPRDLANPEVELTARVHDECNGSDVFGSDICTCRPYLTHAIEECIQGAQRGGVGLVSYSRKEGRALGEVTKFLVYNARKRQVGGDTADQYFARTECVAGVQDMRFQELMPDVLHWLGVRKIHRLVSMSNMKYDAITGSGIEIGERVNIPDELIPADARVEMDAKMAAGYFTPGPVPDAEELQQGQGPGAGHHEGTDFISGRSMPRPKRPRRSCAPPPRSASAPCNCCRGPATANRAGSSVDDGFLESAADESWSTRPAGAIPSCTFRCTAAGAISRPAASTARRELDRLLARPAAAAARPRADRPRRGERAARCRRRARLEIRGAGDRADLHPLRRAGGGELSRVRRRPVLQRHGTARCRPMPRACAALVTDHLAVGVPGQRGQPAGGPARSAPSCCAGWAK